MRLNTADMHVELTIKPLTSHFVRKAYPFAQAIGFHDYASWNAFVKSHARSDAAGTGGIVAEGPHGYVCGLLFYRIDRHRKKGATLVCDPFVAADFPRHDTSVRALLEAADRIALDRGCRWVRVVVPASGDPLSAEGTGCEASLFRAGYALENVSFRRRPGPRPGSLPGGENPNIRQSPTTR